MKRSEIYRQAAQLIADGKQVHSCVAISRISADAGKGYFTPLREHYGHLFCPALKDHEDNREWGEAWPSPRDCRILALCFMAAIAEDEERSNS